MTRFLAYLIRWNRAKERAAHDKAEHLRILWPRDCRDPHCEVCRA